MRWLGLWLVVALTGCVASNKQSIRARFAKDAELQPPAREPARFADAPALGLYSEDGTMMVHLGEGNFYTQKLFHRAYLIQTEQAFGLADVRVIIPPRMRLTSLRARYKHPGATDWSEVDKKDIIVDEGAGTDPDHTASARLFRFPDVEVGSVLEYSYVLEVPYLDTDNESHVPGDFPLRRWVAWVQAPAELVLDTRTYNAPQPTTDFNPRDPDDDGDHRWTVTMSSIPQRPDGEAFAADPTFTQPRLTYRVIKFQPRVGWRRYEFPVLEDWKDVFGRWAYSAYFNPEQRLFDGPDRELNARDCRDAYCVSQRAIAWLNARTRYSGVGSWTEPRRVYEVLSSRQASGFERMLILKWLLDGAKVHSWLASYTARNSEHSDTTFPTLDHLNRPLLYLPRQAGLEQAMWIDPLCESCMPGTVAAEALGVSAKLVEVVGIKDGRPVVNVYDAQVQGASAPNAFRTRAYEAVVMQNGNVELTEHDERSGRLAVDYCAGETEALDLRGSDLHQRALRLSDTVLGAEPLGADCDVAHAWARTGFKAVLPAHAVIDGASLYVPLTLIEPDWRQVFDEESRELPIAFVEGARSMDYKLKVKAPPGFSLTTKAVTERAAAPGIAASYDARPVAGGAEVTLSVSIEPGYHPPTSYAQFRKVADFIRGARTKVLEFRK